MTVKELKEELAKYDDNKNVILLSPEDEYGRCLKYKVISIEELIVPDNEVAISIEIDPR